MQHLGILHTHIIVVVVLRLDFDDPFILHHIGFMVDKGKLEMNSAVKVIQEFTPVLKDRVLILLLCQLIIDVIEANRLGINMFLYAADTVLSHLQIGDRLLDRDLLFPLSFLLRLTALHFPLLFPAVFSQLRLPLLLAAAFSFLHGRPFTAAERFFLLTFSEHASRLPCSLD